MSWEASLEAVAEVVENCPDGTRVVVTSWEAAVVEALEGETVDLSDLALEDAVKMLHALCGGKIVLDDKVAEALAAACSRHPLALDHAAAQLRLKCRRNKCTPEDILASIQDKSKALKHRFKAAGKRKVSACLALSLEALSEEEDEELWRLALGLAVFPVGTSIPLGAIQNSADTRIDGARRRITCRSWRRGRSCRGWYRRTAGVSC